MKKKNVIFKWFIILSQLFLGVSCNAILDSLGTPVKEYLLNYTEQAKIISYEMKGNYIVDESGFYNIPSNEDFCIDFILENPQKYKFIQDENLFFDTAYSYSKIDYEKSFKIFQSDDNTISFVFLKDFLIEAECGCDISPEITIFHPLSKINFGTFCEAKIKSNSPPPKILGANFYSNSKTLAVEFLLPSKDDFSNIHRDVSKIVLEFFDSDNKFMESAECKIEVTETGNIILEDSDKFMTDAFDFLKYFYIIENQYEETSDLQSVYFVSEIDLDYEFIENGKSIFCSASLVDESGLDNFNKFNCVICDEEVESQSTYFVHNISGNDENAGTFYKPLQTIQKAVDKILEKENFSGEYKIYLLSESFTAESGKPLIDFSELPEEKELNLLIESYDIFESNLIGNRNRVISSGTINKSINLCLKNLVIENGFSGGKTDGGGGICFYGNPSSSLKIIDCEIRNNECAKGAGIFVYGADVNVNLCGNTSIHDNVADIFTAGVGGGIAVFEGANLTVEKNVVIKNNSAYYGGGIGMQSKYTSKTNCSPQGNLKLYGTVTKNESNGDGGAGVYIFNCFGEIFDGALVSENFSKGPNGTGGGFYLTRQGNLFVYGGEVIKNESTKGGGGIFMNGASSVAVSFCTIFGGTIKDNISGEGLGIQLHSKDNGDYRPTLCVQDDAFIEDGIFLEYKATVKISGNLTHEKVSDIELLNTTIAKKGTAVLLSDNADLISENVHKFMLANEGFYIDEKGMLCAQ